MDDRRALTFRMCKRARLDGDVSFVVRGNEGACRQRTKDTGAKLVSPGKLRHSNIEIRIAERLTRMVSKVFPGAL